MKEHHETEQINEPEETTALATVDATPAGIMAAIEIADYSQFLYNANMGGKPVTAFTSEGIKTISLQYGISTGPVEIQFLDDGNAAIFTCTATHQNGQTASVNVYQSKMDYGKENKFWIEKGTTRAIRNAQKALLPVELLKTALQRAIAKGEAEQSEITKAQARCSRIYREREKELQRSKRELLQDAADAWDLEFAEWDVELWHQFADALESSDFESAICGVQN